jgi:hypothetical protein
MIDVVSLVLGLVASLFRSRAGLEAEVLVLRQRLAAMRIPDKALAARLPPGTTASSNGSSVQSGVNGSITSSSSASVISGRFFVSMPIVTITCARTCPRTRMRRSMTPRSYRFASDIGRLASPICRGLTFAVSLSDPDDVLEEDRHS